jgi:transglutaminase-like putative cysteine protease
VTGDLVINTLRRMEPRMKNNRSVNRAIPPDWHIIKLDERENWRDDMRAKTTAIYSVYALDKSSRTFLCEATPSYALWWIAYEAEPIEGLSDEEREALYDQIECGTHPDQMVDYMHVSRIETICKAHPERVRKIPMDEDVNPDDDQETVDEIVEGWNSGALSF